MYSVVVLSSGLDLPGGVASVTRDSVRALRQASEVTDVHVVEVNRPANLGAENGVSLLKKASFAVRSLVTLARKRPAVLIVEHLQLLKAVPLPFRRLLVGRTLVWAYKLELEVSSPADVAKIGECDQVLAISQHAAELVAAAGLIEVPQAVIPLAVRPPCAAVERTNTPQDVDLIVSRIDGGRGKGHEALIESMMMVQSTRPEVQLWIVGDGAGREDLERMAAGLGCVRFFGHVSAVELEELYARAAVFAMPSKTDGFGLVYGEAFLRGLPCVASDLGAASELVQHERTGLITPYDDPRALATALTTLLSSPELRQQYATAGARLISEKHTFDCFSRALLAAIEGGPVPTKHA